MEPADKKRMARRILGEYPEEYAKVLEFVDKFPDLQETPAQFQERCGQIAAAPVLAGDARGRAGVAPGDGGGADPQQQGEPVTAGS
ncbi:MAG: hypothetical protein U0797_15605 [Gemmataceae bacterium]